MHVRTTFKMLVAVFTIVAALAAFVAYRAVRWSQSRHQQAKAPDQPAPLSSGILSKTGYEANSAGKSLNSIKAIAPMTEPFDSGVLPAPGAPPTSDPDQAVVTMVQQVAARDANSAAVLMTALQMAGLGIRAPEGSLIVTPGAASQGMALDAWQVAAMAKLYDEHWHISLADLCAVLTKGLPEFRKVDLSQELIDGIKTSAEGNQPLRFWSRLLIELGRNADQPYDLSAEKIDPVSAQLDSIQVALILQRLAGDLSALQGRHSGNIKSFADRPRGPFVAPRIESAVYHRRHRARLVRVDEGSSGPCDLSDPFGLGLDGNAIGQTTEWKNLIDLEKQLEKMAEAGDLKARINIVSTLLKFYLAYAGLHAEIAMDPALLIRNKDTSPGNEAKLTAHITYQLDKWGLNCFLAVLRPWLNLAGLDAGNLTNNGNVPGVGVTWRLVDGGVNTAIKPVDQSTVDAYNATAIVEFNPGSGSEGLHTLVNQITTKNGEATLPVFGAPRRRDLSGFKVVPVKKTFSVAVEVKFKGADPEKFLGELADTLGPALGVASGDVLSGAVAALTEMLYRMSWRVGKTYTFPVQDWQMCDGGWGGTIDLVMTMRGVVNSSGDGWFNSEAMDSVETTEVELTGSSKGGSAWSGLSHGTYSTSLEANPIYIARKSSCSVTTRRHGVASGSGDVDYRIDLPGGDVVQVSPAVTMPYVDATESETVECSGCPGNGGGCKPIPAYTVKRGVELPGFPATVDPETPGVLRGSLTQGTASRVSRTVTWNLVQCGK